MKKSSVAIVTVAIIAFILSLISLIMTIVLFFNKPDWKTLNDVIDMQNIESIGVGIYTHPDAYIVYLDDEEIALAENALATTFVTKTNKPDFKNSIINFDFSITIISGGKENNITIYSNNILTINGEYYNSSSYLRHVLNKIFGRYDNVTNTIAEVIGFDDIDDVEVEYYRKSEIKSITLDEKQINKVRFALSSTSAEKIEKSIQVTEYKYSIILKSKSQPINMILYDKNFIEIAQGEYFATSVYLFKVLDNITSS